MAHNHGDKSQRIGTTDPMPFYAPKGWKSMHYDVEVSLLMQYPDKPKGKDTIANDRKWFAAEYHKSPKKKTSEEIRSENLLGLQFNPDVPKD